MTRALRIVLLLALAALASLAASASAAQPHLSRPTVIAAGPDGNLWVADRIGILRVTTAGRITRMASIQGVDGITAGPDTAVWFASYESHRVGRITPAGDVSYVAQLRGSPSRIATGSDGNLWVSEQVPYRGGTIARVTPAGAVTEFSDGLGQDAEPYDMTLGPDGAVWFTDGPRGSIGRITVDGAITEYAVLADDPRGPEAIAPGPDGAMWFTASGIVGRFAGPHHVDLWQPYFDSTPDIVAGPDGNLWFTVWSGFPETVKLGRITPQGDSHFVGRGFSGIYTEGIVVGPDGNLWVTEHGRTGGHVVRVTPDAVATEFPRRRPPCRVPDLARYPMPLADTKLFESLCRLDPASRRAGRKHGVVALEESPPPGSVHPYGTVVHVKFGPVPRPTRCELPLGGRRVAKTKRALVYTYTDYPRHAWDVPTTVYGACLRPRGRPRTFVAFGEGDLSVSGVIAAGPFVAYQEEEANPDDVKYLELYDVAGKKRGFEVTVEAHTGDGFPTIPGDPKLGDYDVSWRGALAWFAIEGERTRLFVHFGDKTRRVDIGTLTKLRFDGDRLRWRKDGEERSKRIR